MDPQEAQEHQVSSPMDPHRLAHQVHPGLEDHQEALESPEHQEAQATLDPKDNQERVEHLEHQATLEPQEDLDSQETMAVRELATTAHHHALPQAIKQYKRRRHNRRNKRENIIYTSRDFYTLKKGLHFEFDFAFLFNCIIKSVVIDYFPKRKTK